MKFSKYDFMALAFIFLVLLCSLILVKMHKVGYFGVETDFYGAYAPQAAKLLEGKPYTYKHNPPGYCLLLAGVSLLFKDFFTAGKVLSAFSTSLFGVFSYLLIRKLFSSNIAFFVLCFTLITLLKYSYQACSDIVGALAIIFSMWVFLKGKKHPYPLKTIFLVGIFSGIAYLIRAPAIFLPISIVLSIMIFYNKEEIKNRIIKSLCFIISYIMVISPWLIANWKMNGSPFHSTAYLQIATHFYHEEGVTSKTSFWEMKPELESLKKVFLNNPKKAIKKYTQDVIYDNPISLSLRAINFPLYLFMGYGIFIFFGICNRMQWTYYFINIVGYLVTGLVEFHLRFYFFMLPFLFLLATYFVFYEGNFKKIYNRHILRWPAHSILVIVLIIIMIGNLAFEIYRINTNLKNEPRHLIKIAEVIKNRSKANDFIIARNPHIAYLSGLKRVFPLCKSSQEFLQFAKENNVKFLIYSDYEAKRWKGLRDFSTPKELPTDFKMIYQHTPTNTRLYEINISDN